MSEQKLVQNKIDFIKSEILRSGFPLEMEISSILRRQTHEAYAGMYFFDFDEKKSREFDVVAHLSCDKLESAMINKDLWYFSPSLLIECKKSAVYNWVFFRSEPISGWYDIGQSIDVSTEQCGYENSICTEILKDGFLVHYLNGKTPIVTAYKTVKVGKKEKSRGNNQRESEGKDAILDAVSKIIKYMNYQFIHLREFFSEAYPLRKDILFFFPMIVFDGDLYEASFENKLEIKESAHLIFETRYFSNLTKDLVPLYIDVIKKEKFREVLALIEKESKNTNRYLKKTAVQKRISKVFEKTLVRFRRPIN